MLNFNTYVHAKTHNLGNQELETGITNHENGEYEEALREKNMQKNFGNQIRESQSFN